MYFSKSVFIAWSFLMTTMLVSLVIASQSIVVTNTEEFYREKLGDDFDFELAPKSSLPLESTIEFLLALTFPERRITKVEKTSKSANGSFGQMFSIERCHWLLSIPWKPCCTGAFFMGGDGSRSGPAPGDIRIVGSVQ